ncbi:glycosyltransferase [Mucisphaera sp.]|uniref:glycosyltransferase n=1 Tax=Mucisphaera sp. TaxID=2913024 RepID=UPI003D14C22B
MEQHKPKARRRQALNPARKLSQSGRPRVTLIIPCFHAGDTLESTLCSVLDQGYAETELLVVDGGSRDQTLDILDRYEAHINWFDAHTDTGPAEAINRALEVATGSIVGFLDADALLMPQVLGDVARRMSDRDGPDWLVGQAVALDETGQLAEPLAPIRQLSLAPFLRHVQGEPARGAAFYRRSLLEEAGPADPKLRFAWCYDLCARLLAQGHEPQILTRAIAAIRINEMSSIMRSVRKGQERVAVARRFLDEVDPRERYGVWKSCDERSRIYAMALAELDPASAGRYLWDEVRRQPWWITDAAFREQVIASAGAPEPSASYRLAA